MNDLHDRYDRYAHSIYALGHLWAAATARCTWPAHKPGPDLTAERLHPLCRLVWPLALAVFLSYVLKLCPHLSWQETAQNLVLLGCLAGLAVASRCHPQAYHRHGPKLRLALLTYGYAMPVLTSPDAMHAFTPAPSQVRWVPARSSTRRLKWTRARKGRPR